MNYRAILLVTRPGFEPRQAESESAVLPLYYRAILYWNAKIRIEGVDAKRFLAFKAVRYKSLAISRYS